MKRKNIISVYGMLLFVFMLVFPTHVSAVNQQDFLPNDNCSLGFKGELVLEDVQKVNFSFSGKVEMKEGAVARIMLGDEVVAETNKIILNKEWNPYEPTSYVSVTFDPKISLPKGHVYSFVIPAGSFYDNDDPSILSGECSWNFEVPSSLVGYDSQLHDGCTLPWIQYGSFYLGKTKMEAVGNLQVSLYKDGVLLDKTEAELVNSPIPVDFAYITFMFDKRIVLEDGAHYTLVFPEGCVRSTLCKEVANEEISIGITGCVYEAPVLGEENTSGIAPEYFEFSTGLIDPPSVLYYDLEVPFFYFEHLVDVVEGARAYVMCGDEVMAVSDTITTFCYRTTTQVKPEFKAPVRLPKDKDYCFVLPAGSLRSHDDPTVVLGRLENQFAVPNDFGMSMSVKSKIYDGCTMKTIKSGLMYCDNVMSCGKLKTPKLYLYKGDEVVDVADCELGGDLDFTCVGFDFGKTITLEDDAYYQLVFPAGVLYAGIRKDITNRELRININGPSTGVESVSYDDVVVYSRGGILHADGVQPGTEVEVFTSGGSLVRRVTASQSSVSVPLPGKGCYVVRVGGKAHKVAN